MPEAESDRRPKDRSLKPLAMLWPYARQHKLIVGASLVLLLLGTVISLKIPLLFGGVVDAGFSSDVETAQLMDAINHNFLLVFLAAVALGGVGALRFYFCLAFWRADCGRPAARPLPAICSPSARAITASCVQARRCRG